MIPEEGAKEMSLRNLQNFFLIKLVIIFSLAGTVRAYAADESDGANTSAAAPETKAKTQDVNPQANAVPGSEVVDDLLTNNNLRALSGSKSRWSVASQFDYLGGTVNEPLSQDRPDISGASGNTLKSDLDGAISAKYNLNPTNAILAGIGLRWIAPLAGSQLTNYNGTTFDVMNPYVQYQHIYKWEGIQSVLQVTDMQWTQADYTILGYANQINVDQENMYEIGKSKLTVGASTQLQYQFFNQSGAVNTPTGFIPDVSAYQSVYLFTIAPVIEYQLSSKVNLRTLVNAWTYEHYGNQAGPFSFVHDAIYQSVGVGISVTRDIFLYPNLQFLPGQLEADLTNVGITATINLF